MQLHLGLTLTTSPSIGTAAEVAAEGVIVNMSSEPVAVDLVELASPSLAFELVDANGAPIRMPPPPTPGRPDVVVLVPGERRSVPFRAFVPATAPRGRYRARFRYRDAHSDWIELAIL